MTTLCEPLAIATTASGLLRLASRVLGLLRKHLFLRLSQRHQLDRELIDLARETERWLIVVVIHASAGIDADIEGLVHRLKERNGVRDRLPGDFWPSTDRTPVPPLPKPGPSYLKSNTMVCLPAASAAGPSQRKRSKLKKLYTKTGLPFSR